MSNGLRRLLGGSLASLRETWQFRSARLRQSKPLQRKRVQEALIRSDDRNAGDIAVMQTPSPLASAWPGRRNGNGDTKRIAWPDFIR